MKYWISKYALTQGVFEIESDLDSSGKIISHRLNGMTVSYYEEGKEWHRTKTECLKRAEELRLAKIKSVKKQLDRLEIMEFNS